MTVKDMRSLSADAQAEIRMRVVEAVKQGGKQREVARIFGVSYQSVSTWVSLDRKKGGKALQGKQKGRPIGSGRGLTIRQERYIARRVIDKTPEQLKLPFVLWTRAAVQQLIKEKFGILLGLSTVGDYLRRWEFTPQKPAKQSWQRSDAKVKKWLQEEYPAIEARAKQEGARIYWEDETGCRSDHTAGRSYGKKGKTPIIRVNGNRFSCNVISAVNHSGNLVFKVFKGSFVVKVFLDFLKRFVRHCKQKIFLIVDGHPVHRAKVVHQWLEENKEKIELFLLPGYSPDLNPDEFLNQDLKSNLFNVERPKNQAHLVSMVSRFLWRRQKQPRKVAGYFHAPSVRYAA
jgi:transposase